MQKRWTDFFSLIVVINLTRRYDRRAHIIAELSHYKVPFKMFPAYEYENGAFALYQSVKHIFLQAHEQNFENVLILEDDCKFLRDPNTYMEQAVAQLPHDWMQLYLGMSMMKNRGIESRYSENLLKINGGYSTHAVAYSKRAIGLFLESPMSLPLDNMMVNKIQSLGSSFCTNPMLATQIRGFSDIEKKVVDWSSILEKRFAENTQHIERG